ncbi:MAG: hypothetical protein V1754_14015 [Pseudomonadota bacterium]
MADPQTIVMIPTYNEAGNIGQLLELDDDSLGCVVVDDNSPNAQLNNT